MSTGDDETTNLRYLPGVEPATTAPPPAVRADTRPEQAEVLEGELVSDDEFAARQRANAVERWQGYRHDVVIVGQAAKRVVTHDTTVAVTRAVVRNTVVYPVVGLGVAIRWLWETRSGARYERLLHEAEVAGDREALREWETRAEQAKQRRHDRMMDRPRLRMLRIKAAGVSLLAFVALLLLLGIILAVDSGDFSDVGAPISAVVHGVAFVVRFVATWLTWMLAVVLVAGFLRLRHVGRRKMVPRWVTSPSTVVQGEARDKVPDEGAILSALRNLNYGPLNAKIKEGWVPRWILPPVRDGKPGKGWQAQLQLPQGVTVEEIVKRKKVLAHNLMRLPVEVWPTEPKHLPGVLDLWVADQGALSGPIAPWPLLNDGTCDYFKSVPVGVDIRGTVINGRLFEANYALAGRMGSGKSTLIIALLAGAMLDPLVEIDVFVFAENADYDPLKPRLRTLVKGAEPENVEKCMQRLQELFSELGERGRALAEHGVSNNVTRELALKDPRLRPRIMVIDECQNLFLSEHGDDAEELAVKLETTARKYAITLIWATPEPSSDSLPRKMMAITSNKACYAIGDQISNDAALGTGSYKAGISAVSLEPKTDEDDGDVGTAMCRGFQPRPGLMRTFYIRKEQLPPIVARALKLREKAGITPTAITDAADNARDLLDDIATVLEHHKRMRTQEVLQQLTELDRRYERWTFADLKNALPDGAKPYKTGGGLMHVSRALIHEAIADRDQNGSEDDAER